MKTLLTRSTGYIGCNTCIELIKAGYEVVVAGNLCNSSLESLKRVENFVGLSIPFHKVDMCNKSELTRLFDQCLINGVNHFVGLKEMCADIWRWQLMNSNGYL